MRMKKIIVLAILLLNAGVFYSQSTSPADKIDNLKQVIPPSPNSSSLGKYGEWPVSLYTGLPSVNIPLYTVQSGAVNLPISLSYHSAGNKVGEIASWVGLGWSLNAGGVISRSVRGWPDEDPLDGYFVKRQLYSNQNDMCSMPLNTQQGKVHKVSVAKGSSDAEQDVYSFSALGQSFKFYFKPDGTITPVPFNNIKITTNFGPNVTVPENVSWTVKMEDGTKLIFGGSGFLEVNTNPPFDLGYTNMPTSWMLKQIISTDGDVIDFTYTSSVVAQDIEHNQKDQVKYLLNTLNYGNGSCSQYVGSDPIKNKTKRSSVTQLSLNTIESSLARVEFVLNPSARLDLKDGKYLTALKIYSKTENKYIQQYNFNYNYSQCAASNEYWGNIQEADKDYYRKRLKLISVVQVDQSSNPLNQWGFTYNSTSLPSRTSYAQDHWGFYNGQTSNSSLLPKYFYPLPSWVLQAYSNAGFSPPDHQEGANREGDGNYSKAEILETITYPTGGKTTFYFEPNTITETKEVFQNANTNTVTLNLNANSNPFTTSNETTFTITKAQNIYLSLNFYITPSIFNDRPNTKVYVDVVNQATSTIVGGLTAATGTSSYSGNTRFNLLAAGTYILRIKTNALQGDLTGTQAITGDATLTYEQSLGTQTVQTNVGGLRINRTSTNDNIVSQTIDKYYSYENPFVIHPVDIQKLYFTETGEVSCDGTGGTVCEYQIVTRNASTQYSLGSIAGGGIGYGRVTITTNTNGSQGKSITEFSNEPDLGVWEAELYPYPPTNSMDHRRGLVLKEQVYKTGSILLKETVNNYSFLLKSQIAFFKAAYTKSLPSNDNMGVCGAYSCQDIDGDCNIQKICYNLYSEQVQLLSSTTTAYDENGSNPITTTVNNYYDNANNTQPVRIETTDSKGNIVKTISRTALEKSDINAATPLTSSASAAIDEMLVRNIISVPLQKENYVGGVLQSRSLINYKNWTSSVLQPENIQLQVKSNPIETRVEFTKYDNYGNLLEQKKTNDFLHSYIWDYQNTYPIAECSNGDNLSIAFTSFESDGNGNWNYTGPITADLTALTGKRVYSLPGGNITKTGLSPSATYIVSYWSKNGAQSVNGVASIAGRTVSNWTYYEHKIINPSGGTITVSGTGVIDELRLYPLNGLMTTFTYEPLIGMISQCDANNRISYYEYDGFGRLVLIRDQDRNIIKKICYNYAGQTENCSAYGNVQKSGNFTRNNCSGGGTGASVTYTIPANTYFSFTSQAEADAKAQSDVDNNGQAYANNNGTCAFYNVQKSGNFTRNNCPAGGTPSSVTYTVAAGTYSSTISQATADQLAQNDVNANGQTYANNNGTCTFYNVQKSGNFTRNNCPAGGTPSTVTYTVAAGTYSSTTSQATADQLAQNDVNANGQTYANNNGTCTFYNVQKSGDFTRNNCQSGYAGSTVTYTVPANTYSSTTSQAAADQLAQNDVNANGQTYANANGTCTPIQITLTSMDNIASGFTAVYTNVSTGEQYSFNINQASNPQTMGTIPPATYNITISKSGNTTRYVFGVYNNSCTLTTASGRSATFFNIVVSTTSSCNGVEIDSLL
jgi:YD repeat-containing protein